MPGSDRPRNALSATAADKKLRKAVILELARQLGRNVCLDCGSAILDPDDLAIRHVEDWSGNLDLFFDLTNVALGHTFCKDRGPGRGHGAHMIEVIIEDEKGRPLRGCRHEGRTYVAGEHGQRYQVRIANRSAGRVLAVVTVDGRNVNTSKPGSWDGSGYVLDPRGSVLITGWRTSEAEVAAFQFGGKDGSYSAQLGSPQNVGVIGVAAFEEKRVPVTISPPTIREPLYKGAVMRSSTLGSVLRGSAGDAERGPFLGMDMDMERGGDRSPTRTRGRVRTQELGTEFGKSLTSPVTMTTFERATQEPREILEIRYDSLSSLVRAGIMTETLEPQAFPSSGFCQLPPNRGR